MPATLSDVTSISTNASGSVWAVTKSHQVYKYDPAEDAWQAMPGTLKQIAAGSESNIWGVSADGTIWKWTGGGNPWTPVSSPAPGGLAQISASSDGHGAWGVDADGKIWRNADGGESWEHIPAPKAAWVSAGAGIGTGQNVWSVDVIKQIWRYSAGSPEPWVPAGGSDDFVQVSARGPILRSGQFAAEAWGVSSHGDVRKYLPPLSWGTIGSGLKQITVGSDIWGIDTSDVAVHWTPPSGIAAMPGVAEAWTDSQEKRWDAIDRNDQFQSTHLWIVSRAAEVAKAHPIFGNQIFNLVQPGAKRGENPFHDALADGLWSADEEDPYRNSVAGNQTSATYKSHFYDPQSGQNWLHEHDPTALTEAPRFFAEAVTQYKNGNIHAAGFNLGLSLHYLTDMTQPMHTSNYTYLSSLPWGYHTDFERYAIEAMKDVRITQPYVPSELGSDPANYVKAIAMKSRPRSAKITDRSIVNPWKVGLNSWKDAVKPEIEGALIDGVAITAQYLIAWMQAAQRTVSDNDPRIFIQAFGGENGYWAVDKDGHLFRRIGWSYGWRLINAPNNARVISICPDGDGGVYAVTMNDIQYLDRNERWKRVYQPEKGRLHPQIQQLAVVDWSNAWALDPNGRVYQGKGSLPQASWTDTGSPPVTGISANSADSVWGVNAKNHGVWEYRADNWQLRGEDLISVSVDLNGKPWGISSKGQVVRYDGSSWQTPPEFSNTGGEHQTPEWGALSWIDARGRFVVVDQQGVAWSPSGVTVQGENPWMPLG